MARYDNRDVSFDSPEGWEDRSVISYEMPGPPGAKLNTNITMMRVDNKAPSLQTFVVQQIATLASALPRFELVHQKSVTFGGLPAIEVLYTWATPDGAVTQRITVYQRKGQTYSFTATAMKSAFQKALPQFDAVADSIRFAEGAPATGQFPPRGG